MLCAVMTLVNVEIKSRKSYETLIPLWFCVSKVKNHYLTFANLMCKIKKSSNHYCMIQLYNNVIDAKTTDEEILAIRAKYVKWKEAILAYYKNNDYSVDEDEFSSLISFDGLFGTLSFLNKPIDVNNAEIHYEQIKEYINQIKKNQV